MRQLKWLAIVAIALAAAAIVAWLLARAFRRAPIEEARPEAPKRESPIRDAREIVDPAVANILASAAAQPGDERSLEDLFPDAILIVTSLGGVSVPALQRKLKIDFDKAHQLVERMEAEGLVGPAVPGAKRKILPAAYELAERFSSDSTEEGE
jgi:DNA segregation ATPase FtsK/SpoIIIE-like protein